MIFENSNAAFKVINAVHISDTAANTHISSRTFWALSFRIKSDTEIISNGRKYSLNDGDIAFFPINTPYDRISKKDELIAVHFELFNDATNKICIYTPKKPEEYEKLFRELLCITQRKDAGSIYRANAVFNTIFASIFKEKEIPENNSERFLCAKKYIDNNYSDCELSIDDISAYCGLSDGYLRSLFKKEANMSPKKYLTHVRMQHASSLINSGYYKISQVSEIVGFSDPKYFSQVYKKFSASSPKGYCTNAEKINDHFHLNT